MRKMIFLDWWAWDWDSRVVFLCMDYMAFGLLMKGLALPLIKSELPDLTFALPDLKLELPTCAMKPCDLKTTHAD